ncbi:MAG: cell division protein FtsQ/DivIB [Amphiplicatus sp.]
MASKAYKRSKPKAKAAPKKPAAKARAKEPAGPTLFERLGDISQNYALAGVAGVAIILAIAAGVLWAGGYVGLVGEKMNRAIDEGAVAAGFEIRRVTLKGRTQTANDELLDALGPVVGASLLHFDAHSARARIEELGWVRAAAVSRLLPDTVQISIRERNPSAVWQVAGALHLIDESGAAIREIGAYEYSNLPLIVGSGAPEAAAGVLQALGAHPALKDMTAALVRVSERRWNMRLRNEIDVKLPESGYVDALDKLAALHDAHGTLDQKLEYIDLRDPERMVIRRRGEAADEPAQ